MKRIRSFFIFTALLCLTACKEDVQNTYSNYPAYFVYKNVNTVPQLNAALNSLGVYTTIRRDRDRFLFTDESGHTTPVNAEELKATSFFDGIDLIVRFGLSRGFEMNAITRSLHVEEEDFT